MACFASASTSAFPHRTCLYAARRAITTAQQIRSSVVNASRSEAARLTLPRDFGKLDRDSLGWRGGKMPLRGYLVVPGLKGATGAMLRAPEGGAKKSRSVLCELCRDVFSKDDVLLWVARRAGQPGRKATQWGH
jgi:hypothetical protein